MPKIKIDYQDGQYGFTVCDQDEEILFEIPNADIPQEQLDLWLSIIESSRLIQSQLCKLDNEWYAQQEKLKE